MTLICVDDHPLLLDGLVQNVRFASPDADVAGFTNTEQAFSYAEQHGCDVLFCEIDMYSGSGLLFAKQIRQMYPKANIVFVTVCSENEHAKAVFELRPSGYITKPATREQIAAELSQLRYPVAGRESGEGGFAS